MNKIFFVLVIATLFVFISNCSSDTARGTNDGGSGDTDTDSDSDTDTDTDSDSDTDTSTDTGVDTDTGTGSAAVCGPNGEICCGDTPPATESDFIAIGAKPNEGCCFKEGGGDTTAYLIDSWGDLEPEKCASDEWCCQESAGSEYTCCW